MQTYDNIRLGINHTKDLIPSLESVVDSLERNGVDADMIKLIDVRLMRLECHSFLEYGRLYRKLKKVFPEIKCWISDVQKSHKGFTVDYMWNDYPMSVWINVDCKELPRSITRNGKCGFKTVERQRNVFTCNLEGEAG